MTRCRHNEPSKKKRYRPSMRNRERKRRRNRERIQEYNERRKELDDQGMPLRFLSVVRFWDAGCLWNSTLPTGLL